MEDRLISLLTRFELRAHVFKTGTLRGPARFDASGGSGFLHLLRRGALDLEVTGARKRKISDSCLIFCPRPVRHRLVPTGAESPELVSAMVEFGTRMNNPLTQAVPRVLCVPLHDVGEIAGVLATLFREATETHCGRQTVLDRLAEVVVVLLLRHLMDRDVVSSGVLAGLADPRLMNAINAMHREPAYAWSLDSLAHAAGMSRARFALHFRRTVGQTPGAYLSDWRISLAQTLLRQGKPVKVAASEVGYESASALARAFRSRLRISPTDWVKRESHAVLGGQTVV